MNPTTENSNAVDFFLQRRGVTYTPETDFFNVDTYLRKVEEIDNRPFAEYTEEIFELYQAFIKDVHEYGEGRLQEFTIGWCDSVDVFIEKTNRRRDLSRDIDLVLIIFKRLIRFRTGFKCDTPAEDVWRYIEMCTRFREHRHLGRALLREIFTGNFSWAIPTRGAIDEIVKFVGTEKVLEIGAGRGLWAKLLKSQGVDITATDVGDKGKYYKFTDEEYRNYTDVEIMDAERAVKKYKPDILMLVWPPMTPMSGTALETFLRSGGKKVVFVGEDESGCTGDEKFFEILNKHYEQTVPEANIKRWDGLWDCLFLYEKATSRCYHPLGQEGICEALPGKFVKCPNCG